jgi:predicted GNAT family acetyltransferase
MDIEIQHNKETSRFLSIIDGSEAYLTYMKDGNDVLILNHTYVPFRLRGNNIAAKIVEYALIYARENNFKVVPACSYVRVFMERHKQYNDLISE